MMRHINIPIFIPHLGCPNQCVFCNQRTISGTKEFDVDKVRTVIEENLSSVSSEDYVEIAFFGGSFTGIDRDLMVSLLKIGKEYIDRGLVNSLRCSTRPDYIDEEILKILKQHGMKTVELGLQSAKDSVLCASKRGHSFEDEIKACKLIKEYGFVLVGQMMIGLPESTLENELETADFIIAAGADFARIYPTVVFRDTELCNLATIGKYTPLELDEAVYRTSRVLERFVSSSVGVIRVGLCASDNLSSKDTYYAGPNHPALGELVDNEIYYRLISERLSEIDPKARKNIKVFVSKGAVSKAIGQKRKNKLRLISEFSLEDIDFIEDETIPPYRILVQ